MPIYVYKCNDEECQYSFSVFYRNNKERQNPVCEKCGGETHKIIQTAGTVWHTEGKTRNIE